MIGVNFVLTWYEGNDRKMIERHGFVASLPLVGSTFSVETKDSGETYPAKYRVDEVERLLFDSGPQVGIGAERITIRATRLRAGR